MRSIKFVLFALLTVAAPSLRAEEPPPPAPPAPAAGDAPAATATAPATPPAATAPKMVPPDPNRAWPCNVSECPEEPAAVEGTPPPPCENPPCNDVKPAQETPPSPPKEEPPPPPQPAPVESSPSAAPALDSLATRSTLSRGRDAAVILGVRAGAVFPQAFNKLDTNFLVDVQLGYQLPFARRRLGIFIDAAYSQPTSEGTRTDPRITTNGGMESYTLTVRDLGISVGVQWFQPLGHTVLVYGGVAYKLHLTESNIDQTAGTNDLGTNTEDSTRHGVVVHVGVGLRLGPGAVVLEGHYEYTPVDHLITGDDNTAHFALQLGYTLFL